MNRLKKLDILNLTYRKNKDIVDAEVVPCLLKKEINEDDSSLEIGVLIKSTKERPFPFDVECTVKGYFDLVDGKDYLNNEATQLLYSYVRTYISVLTSITEEEPIRIPFLDAKDLFDQAGNEPCANDANADDSEA